MQHEKKKREILRFDHLRVLDQVNTHTEIDRPDTYTYEYEHGNEANEAAHNKAAQVGAHLQRAHNARLSMVPRCGTGSACNRIPCALPARRARAVRPKGGCGQTIHEDDNSNLET